MASNSVRELLKELPSFNQSNFSRYHRDSTCKPSNRRPAVYLPTKDVISEEQSESSSDTSGFQTSYNAFGAIVTDKTNILLRYLHHQWEAKNSTKKRDTATADLPEQEECVRSRKMQRVDLDDDSPD